MFRQAVREVMGEEHGPDRQWRGAWWAVALIGLVVVWRLLPETKGKSLEELEAELVRS